MDEKEKNLSNAQIDNVFIKLKQQEIEEQIRSNKVIEGILKDICNNTDRIADNFGLKPN